jgi:hypothetical protein
MRIILIAALFSLPILAAATTPTLAANYGSSATGGGSAGYNAHNTTNYRLKKHHPVIGKKLHNQVKPAKSAKSATPAKSTTPPTPAPKP